MIDSIEAQLNAIHGTRWDTYRRSDGDWNVVVKDDKPVSARQISVHAPSLTEAMVLAIDVRFIPQVPRRPQVDNFFVEKDGRDWSVRARGDLAGYGTAFKTKKRAEEVAQQATERSLERSIEWARDWLPVTLAGVEGTDWEYER